jgi:hypothetical protein
MNIITINSQIKWNVFLNLKTNLIKKKVESLFKIIFVFIVNENRKNYVCAFINSISILYD